MKSIHKILLLSIFGMLSFLQVDAQKKVSKKKQTTTAKKSSKKKQPEKKKNTVAASKNSAATKSVQKKVVKSSAEVVNAPIAVDTVKPNVVVLYAAFKPSLRNAAKINFTAATPILDTSKVPLTYVVPSQNLFFTYQPVTIKPLSLYVDSSIHWVRNGYVKLGFGNYTTPYAEAAMSFGNGQKSITNIFAKHISSTGNIPFQQFGKTDVAITGLYAGKSNTEWSTNLFFNNNVQYQYGFEPSSLIFTKDQLKQSFSTVGLKVGFRNKMNNRFGITYSPTVNFNYFMDSKNAKETNLIVTLPINKTITRMLAFDLTATADITNCQTPANTIKNNLFFVNPTIQFRTPNFKLNIGIQPSWDNQINSILPNITAESKLGSEKIVLKAGWIGSIQKNNYQYLASINPWLAQPISFTNTQKNEIYTGIKGSVGSHLTYNTQLSLLKLKGQPLFTNDLIDGKSFITLYDENLQLIKIHAEIGYSVQENFSFIAAATYNQFTKTTFDKAYGMVPLEITGTLKWKILKDVFFNADLFFWDGTQYRNKSLALQKLNPAIDLNTGVEYRLTNKFNLWLQINNVLNNNYQRWSQYQVLGFNVIAGVVYSFSK
jgi:hypothetical protein